MLKTLRNAWHVPELRKKLIFTLIMLFVYRLGCFIPVPGIDVGAMRAIVNDPKNGLFGLIDIISGGSFANFTIFALGVTPYITASIIMQLLSIAIPRLERLSKEEDGKKKINHITRYVSIGLALVETIGFIMTLQNGTQVGGTPLLGQNAGFMTYITIALTVAAGCGMIMWMGEQITKKGVGNGISLLIFISIVARFPTFGMQIINAWKDNWWMYIVVAAVAIGIVAGITFVDLGQRRVPVQYAKQQKGRKLYGGQTTHIPIKVNSTGVLPIIFAVSFVSFPQLVAQFFPNSSFQSFIAKYFSGTGYPIGQVFYIGFYLLLIIAFTYFYVKISVNIDDMSKNLQQYGGSIQGVRPGEATTKYLKNISDKLTFFGAIFLAIVAILPYFFPGSQGARGSRLFSATSILIMVSVALETSKQLESQMLMRHYKGFLS